MKRVTYEILKVGIQDTNEAIRGKDIFYKCDICHSIISSTPKDSVGCECGNIEIDREYVRLYVKDYSKFLILRSIKPQK
jgi:cytochrome c2